jgi:N-acetyl-alpha-D-muramate 1-phosphate uridylyltransferase
MKAMILAAGTGTRMLPLTRNMPKALIEIRGVTLLEHTIQFLKYYGVDEIIINIHHCADQIVTFLKKNNYFNIRIETSDESNELLGTGGGLKKAQWFFSDKEPFILTASDIITDLNIQDMVQFHIAQKPLATLAVKHRSSTREFIFDTSGRLVGWRNNATGEIRRVSRVGETKNLAFSAIHIINPELFKLINEKGHFSITDTYLRLASEKIIKGFEHDQSVWFECGRVENLEKLNLEPEIERIYRQLHK